MQELLRYDISSTSYLFDDEGMMKSATKVTSQKSWKKSTNREFKPQPQPHPLFLYNQYSLFGWCDGQCQKEQMQK